MKVQQVTHFALMVRPDGGRVLQCDRYGASAKVLSTEVRGEVTCKKCLLAQEWLDSIKKRFPEKWSAQ